MNEVTVESDGYLKQKITAGNHVLTADEPISSGGQDSGPDPYSLLLASLGACTSMTIQMYAHRKGFPLEKVIVRLTHERIYAKDCEECESKEGVVGRIERHITVRGALTEEQKAKLLEIAGKCPVGKTLTSELLIKDFLATGDPACL